MLLNYTFNKSHTLYFSEEISEIETIKDSKYTVFCLQTKIYVYEENGHKLFDIVACCNPTIYSAICKSLSGKAVIASLCSSGSSVSDYKEDSVQIKDYSSSGAFASDSKIIKPFGNGYEIGGLALDEEGHRLSVVSKDACYLYLFVINNLTDDKKPIETVQRFNRGQNACTIIYKPIQIVINSLSNPQNFPCDFILLSSSSETTHLFRIGEAA